MSHSGGGTPRGAWAGRRRVPAQKEPASAKRTGSAGPGGRSRASTPGPGQYEQDYNTIYRDVTERAWRGSMHGGPAAAGPRGPVVHRGVMTDHEGLEEEVARLNARIAVLVRAGADYREKVDDLFMTTKEESERSASKTTQQLAELQAEREALQSQVQVATALLEQEKAQHEEVKAEAKLLREQVLAADRRVEDARAAQRRVEEELEVTAAECDAYRRSQADNDARMQRTERECAELTEQMAAQQAQLVRLQKQADEAKVQQSLVADLRSEQKRWIEESASLEDLINALQNRNQDLEKEVGDLHATVDSMVCMDAHQEALETCERVEEKLRSLEASNRVLHRETDRRKQGLADATTKLQERDALIEELEERLADAMAAPPTSQAVPNSPKTPGHADDATHTDAHGAAPDDALFGRVVEECMPRKEELEELTARYEALQGEHDLLVQQLSMERDEDARIRALCQELHDEVEKLTDENDALRGGLQTIEKSFGKLLPEENADESEMLHTLTSLAQASPRGDASAKRSRSILSEVAGGGLNTPRRPPSAPRGTPGGSPDRGERACGDASQQLRYLALRKRDAFAQTTLAPATPRGGGGDGVWSPDRVRRLAQNELRAQQQLAMLRREVETLQRRRAHERTAVAAAFKAKLKELMKSFRGAALQGAAQSPATTPYHVLRDGDGAPTFHIEVDVSYPPETVAVYSEGLESRIEHIPGGMGGGVPQDRERERERDDLPVPLDFDANAHMLHATSGYGGEHSARCQLRDELALLRRRTQEAEAYARRSEGLAAMVAQLKQENEDLREHVRRLTSSDPHARTVHGLLSTTLRAAEKRLNETLSRFKAVLRNRSVLVHHLQGAMASVNKLRDCAGELHIYLRSALSVSDHLAADVFPRLAALGRFVDDASSAHRVVAAECLTLWEKTALGLASESLKPRVASRDVQGELRATEDLLNTLWVTFTLPGAKSRSPRSVYSPVTSVVLKDGFSSPRRGDVTYPPAVQIGKTATRGESPPGAGGGDYGNSYARKARERESYRLQQQYPPH